MAQAHEYDLLIGNVGETWSMEGPADAERLRTGTAGWVAAALGVSKPVAFVMGDVVTGQRWEDEALAAARQQIADAGIAVFPTVRRAARALSRLSAFYRERGERLG